MIGETINDRYQIKTELGRGGMGTVYRAHDSALSRDVAVKLMSNTKLGTEGRARLQHEAQIIAQLNHPNIVTVFDVGEYQNFPFIVMELVEGGTLHDSRPTELPEILAAARQIATALQHAHSHDIIHRDLKPENISLDSENNIRLMDFGLARSVASRLTSEGGIVGTVYYMAPEQAMGKDVSPSADLYALGVILYELTTGALPFEDPDPIAVISQHIHAPPINARLKNPDLPPRLSDLIMSLLSKEPEERPASAQVILSALEDSALLDTAAAPAEELSLLDRIVRGRIIGRKTEFEEARALWSKTQSGQGQLLLISGEPGVGKTRLMREIATHAEVSGGRALIGESFADGNPPYGAFGQVVRSALTADSSNGFHLSDFVLADLLNIAPELRQHYPDVPPNPSLEPEAQRQRLFENVTSFCAALTEQRPLLVVIDDAHWSDSGTLFLLRHLARRTQDLPVMLVATYREIELIGTHPLNELLLELNRQRLGSRVKLSRLDVNDTRQLLEAIFAEFVSLEFAEIIYRETEGNPFFIEEVCKSLVESGVLYYQDGEWHRPDLEEIQIPQSVQVAVEARLSNLDAQTIDILRLAATLGREFEFNTLTKTGETTEDQVINALEIAEEAQLLSEVSGKAGGVFSFAHALIPAALISGLSGLRRRRLHRQALAAEQELHPEDFASLSHHASEAGDVENTLQYAEKAGTTAAALYAWEEAHAQYQRAIEAAEELGQTESLAKLYDLAGDARAGQGVPNQAIEHHLLAMQLSEDPHFKSTMKAKAGVQSIYIGDNRGLTLLEEARTEFDPKTHCNELAWVLVGIGRHYHLHGQHQKALQAYQDAREFADKLEDHTLLNNLLASILALSAGAHQHLANFDESNQLAQASIDLGQREDNPFAEAVGLEFLGENATNVGAWQHAIDIGAREEEIGLRIGDQNRLAWTAFYVALGHYGLGQLAEAETTVREGLEIAERIGDKRLIILQMVWISIVLADTGRLDEAEIFARKATESAEEVDQIFMLGNSKVALANLHLKREQWSHALQLLQEIEESLEGSDAGWFPIFALPLIVQAHIGLQEYDLAGELAEQNYRTAVDDSLNHIQSDALRFLAHIAFTRENYDLALEKLTTAIDLAEKENDRLRLARAALLKAEILSAQGDAKSAQEAASQAAELFETCGALPELEKARSLLKSIT